MQQQIAIHNFRVRAFSTASALLGVWLIISPRLLHTPSPSLATSVTVVGALVLASAAVRFFAGHTVALSWLVLVLGAWTVASPWTFGIVTGDARTWNYIICGILLAGVETYSITSSSFRRAWRPGRDLR
jgi:hypothetical protein